MARFQNQATLFSNNAVTLSNIVYGDLNDAYSINKTALKSNYVLNDSITYVVTIINNGAAALTGLTLTDNLGAYTFGAANLVPFIVLCERRASGNSDYYGWAAAYCNGNRCACQ